MTTFHTHRLYPFYAHNLAAWLEWKDQAIHMVKVWQRHPVRDFPLTRESVEEGLCLLHNWTCAWEVMTGRGVVPVEDVRPQGRRHVRVARGPAH